jgi:signal transduction histidine kinase/CheY-like chemotaxis protein
VAPGPQPWTGLISGLEMLTRFQKKTPPGLYAAIVLSTVGIFLIDVRTAVGVATWLFYMVPLGLCILVSRPALPLFVAATATLLIGVDYFVSPPGVAAWISELNRLFGVVMMWGFAFVTRKLIVSRLWLQQRDWVRNGQNLLAQQVLGENSLNAVSRKILEFLAGYLDAQVGAIYVLDTTHAVRTAGFALSAEKQRETIALGEGIAGQTLSTRKAVRITELPHDYLNVNSTLGSRKPASLLVSPITADNEAIGVVELGFLQGTYELDLELLNVLSEPMGIAMRTARLRSEREALLQATQRQAGELQAQQEELRVSNEELEQQSNMLRDSQARLETQQAELEQINVQLEEHAQTLARQNDELDAARSELEAKAAELTRSNQFKSEFLANMSHELRTPLNSSLILAKLLGDNRDGNLTAEQVKFANNIHAAGNDLLELINDILDLSKIEARKVEVNRETVGLQRLIEDLTQTFRPVAEQKNVALNVTVDASCPPTLQTDSQRLRQILKNLLSNALKFTTRGSVSLRAWQPQSEWLAFAVADTGIGIPAEQREIIFEPFRQADGTTNRRFGGTGLGLSISRELATLLGGHIELQSTPGTGSTFTLMLPQTLPQQLPQQEVPTVAREVDVRRAPPPVRAPVAAKPATADQPAFVAKHGRVLLIIEDDVGFANTLCELASSLNYDCVIAHTADTGIELALRHQPVAIVLDIRLPDHTGLSVLDRLKHNSATRHIPVQVISGFDYGQAALEMGAASVMMKPVERDKLVEALANLEKTGRGERAVLIVEDNSIQRDSIRQLLTAENIRTVAVDSAAAALEHLRQTTFDCMVLDLALPDASGYELLEKMAGDDAYSFPPVIVYTGRSLSAADEQHLRRYSKSIIIKGAKSPERLLDEVTLFLHQVESKLSVEHQRMLREARSREAVFEGRRILLVEDDVRNVFAISRVLEPHGAKLEIARNGKEALAALEHRTDIDLVLMDIMMPEMDGLEATREIRKRDPMAKVPIIALTAKAMPDDRQRCLDAGANDYITKPIDIEKLLSLVRIWLPGKKA